MNEWWQNGAGFFGRNYIRGDNSAYGFLPDREQNLEERTKREVEGVVRLLNLSIGQKVLDVPCGYGRHSIGLSRKGYVVTGVDINDEMLDAAKCEKSVVTFLNRDMRNIGSDLYGQFNAVINMFYSFGFFKSEEENRGTMQEFYNALQEGGKLLLHTDVSPEMFGRGYKFRERRDLQDGGSLIIEEDYDYSTKRINGLWEIMDTTGKRKLTPYSVRVYTQAEFDQLARDCGFTEMQFYGSFEREEFTADSKELIMVAKR